MNVYQVSDFFVVFLGTLRDFVILYFRSYAWGPWLRALVRRLVDHSGQRWLREEVLEGE